MEIHGGLISYNLFQINKIGLNTWKQGIPYGSQTELNIR